MFKLKFGILPGHWGLAGKTREVARAEYELTGYDLLVRLLEINKDSLEIDVYNKSLWDIELKFTKITESQYHRNLLSLIKDEKQKALATLELDHRDGTITELVYTKNIASLKNEPWVTVLNMDFAGKTALEGSFELDWNEQFVEKLRAEGYTGPTDDIIVNQWFMTVCKNIALEEFDGVGNFTADAEANLDAVKRWSSDSRGLPEGKKGYR